MIKKITIVYHDIFTLPGDALPSKSLASYKIVWNEDKIINLRQPRHPECHREVTNQVNGMLTTKIIAESDSPYNSPLWVVPNKRDASGKANL